jgi:hypothetical protein
MGDAHPDGTGKFTNSRPSPSDARARQKTEPHTAMPPHPNVTADAGRPPLPIRHGRFLNRPDESVSSVGGVTGSAIRLALCACASGASTVRFVCCGRRFIERGFGRVDQGCRSFGSGVVCFGGFRTRGVGLGQIPVLRA